MAKMKWKCNRCGHVYWSYTTKCPKCRWGFAKIVEWRSMWEKARRRLARIRKGRSVKHYQLPRYLRRGNRRNTSGRRIRKDW